MRRLPMMLIALFVTLPVFAVEPAPKPMSGDEQELVFLQSSRPYRLRLHQQIGGLSFQQQWNDIFLKLFQFLDQDGDGVLSAKELEHAPSPNQLRGLIQGAAELEADEAPKLADVTDNPKGAVTPAQLRGYYLRTGVAPWQAEWAGRTSDTDLYDDELFKLLADAKTDKLTRAPISTTMR